MFDVIEYSVALENKPKSQRKQIDVPLKWLGFVFILSIAVTTAELVLAQLCHSITLLILVHQNVYNSISLLVLFLSSKYSKETSLKTTFGWHRLEVVGSIVSLVFLSSLCFATFIEAIQTLFHSDHLDTMHHPDWILLTLAGHTGVWGVIFAITGGPSHVQNSAVRPSKVSKSKEENSKEKPRASFTDILSQVNISEIVRDLQGLFYVLVTCCLIKFEVLRENFSVYVDPIIGIIFVISLLWSSYSLAVDSSNILLQTIPGNVEFGLLKKVLLVKFPDILNIHEMHVWTLNPGNLVLSAHIKFRNQEAYFELINQVENFFKEHDINLVTIQPEFACPDLEDGTCTWSCLGKNCSELTCCTNEIEACNQDDSLPMIEE